MKRTFLLPIVLCGFVCAASATPPAKDEIPPPHEVVIDEPVSLTPEQSASADQVASSIVAACHEKMDTVLKDLRDRSDGSERSSTVINMMQGPEYCDCVGSEVRARLTPTLLQSGTEEDGARITTEAIYTCSARRLKPMMATMCRQVLAGERTGLPVPTEAQRESACSCLEEAAAKVDGAHLQGAMADTMRDYEDLRRNPAQPLTGRPDSLVPAMQACFAKSGVAMHKP